MKRSALMVALLGSFSLASVVTTQAFASDKKTASEDSLAPQVSLDELKKLVETKGAFIIDANGTKMYQDGHVPGAVSFAEHEKDFASVLPKDKNTLLVAYCGGTMCTAWKSPAEEAKKLGYTNIKHFKGGIAGWKSAGMQVETAKKS